MSLFRPAAKLRRGPALAVLATSTAMLLSACGSGSGGTTPGAAAGSGSSGSGSRSVYALVSGTNVPYLATYAETLKKEATATGATLTVLSADYDASKQAQQFDQAIAAKPSVIIVAAVDTTAVVPSLLKAKNSGIPVIASNTGVDESGKSFLAGFTGPDDVLEGKNAATLMAEALGSQGQIAIVEGALGTSAQINRSKGFVDELTASAPGIRVLDKQTGSWDKEKARSAAANFITRFGAKLTGIFAEDDTMASGAAQAVADAGMKGKIKIVGIGGSTQGFDGIKDGSIFGTVIQSPVDDAKLAVKAATAVANGETIPAEQYLTPTTVKSANVSQFTPEW